MPFALSFPVVKSSLNPHPTATRLSWPQYGRRERLVRFPSLLLLQLVFASLSQPRCLHFTTFFVASCFVVRLQGPRNQTRRARTSQLPRRRLPSQLRQARLPDFTRTVSPFTFIFTASSPQHRQRLSYLTRPAPHCWRFPPHHHVPWYNRQPASFAYPTTVPPSPRWRPTG